MAKLAQTDAIAAMASVPMFSALDDSAVRKILAGCRSLQLPGGSQVFRPSQQAERFYVIVSGRVKIFKISPKGDEQILHLYGPGETFGEAAMLTGIEYPAHAETLSDATLLAVPRRVISEAIADNPELAMGMLAGLSRKLREFNLLIEELSLKEVPARLAGVLLARYRQGGSKKIRLPMTKRQLAARIGTVAETLSRALKKMKSAGLIDVNRAEITILDPQALEELAESL